MVSCWQTWLHITLLQTEECFFLGALSRAVLHLSTAGIGFVLPEVQLALLQAGAAWAGNLRDVILR